MNYNQARDFIYKNARPLDLACWKYLFEGGSQEDVLTALVAYQNDDGGFGHALEPDCWNPYSSPIQTWVATEINHEIGLEDKEHPVVQGILRYLSSRKDFDSHTWANTIASNNDAPHTVFCFVRLYDYLKESNTDTLIDLAAFKELLQKQLQQVITYDTDKWATEYVCKPSLFIGSKASDFYEENREMCEYECAFIENSQEPDGTWVITWSWTDYPEEWSISKNWWKSDWIIRYLSYVKAIRGHI